MAADRVCLVRHGIFPGEARIRREAAALVERGYEVDVVCLRLPGEPARELVEGVRVHRLPLTRRRGSAARYVWEYGAFAALAAARVAALHARRRYSVVQVHTLPDFLVVAGLVPRLAGARLLLDLQEVMPELFRAKFPGSRLAAVVDLVERGSIAAADHVLVPSEPIREILVARGVPAERITVVMNSADEQLFRPQSRAQPAGAPPMLVSHGTVIERYGFQTAVRALAFLRDDGIEARLRIAGGGEYLPELERLVAELGLADRVELLGLRPLEQIPTLLADADVGIVPNEPDAYIDLMVPTKLMEYVALGLPAVVARSRAVEAYFDETTVDFYRAGDPRDLARALRRALAEPERLRANADRARDQFLARHGWARMKEDYVEVVDRLARAR